ncbi:hypothetical protein AK88_04161 [Plasmodium fragile]|uniref:Serine/threonine-protein phosphatase n=1 Tax=Plasmodium fragile TaxID=5857 RepID=A0A0D9QGL2_PLAFR|nr:uncharacterized protein AK88_04161 [Plasmodium fragile]KJP86190.1 hypothetical protein AK88_04161 [Plasmodium fragile]
MRNVAETRTNRPSYVTRKDTPCGDAVSTHHPCVTLPDHRYPANTYGRGYHASAGGALLKGGTSNGNQAIPTTQINSLAALKMGRMGSPQVDPARQSCDGSSQVHLADGSSSLLHLYENEKYWSDDKGFVKHPSAAQSSTAQSSTAHSSGVHLPMVNSPVVYRLSEEANGMGGRRVGHSARGEQTNGRSVSQLAHHNQRVNKGKESHAGCFFPGGMDKIYTGDDLHGHTKRAPLMNASYVGSSEGSIGQEVLHSWWGDGAKLGSPSSEASNGYTVPSAHYHKLGHTNSTPGVVLLPLNRRTRDTSTRWYASGKDADAGLVHKWSSGRWSGGHLSKTSEYSYRDFGGVMYRGMRDGSCYPDDASVESLPRNSFPWGSSKDFLTAQDNSDVAVLGVGGRHYGSGGQWHDQTHVRRLSGDSLFQSGVVKHLDEGGYTGGLESLESISPVGGVSSWEKATDGATALRNEDSALGVDADRITECTYKNSDFTEWVSHNQLVKNIISSHNEEGDVDKHGLYSLLFDAYGHNKEAFRKYLKGDHDTSMDVQIGQAVEEIKKDKKKSKKKSNTIVEKIIFLKYLFNEYAHTDYPNLISFKCFKQMFESYKNVFASEKIILFIFNCLDRCRRYYVSESDFLIGMLACSPHMDNNITKDTGRLRHQLIFRAYDLDRDGYWSRDEMFVFLYHLYELSKGSKHMELKANKRRMKKFVAVQRDKLMHTCEKISYDNFYHLVVEGKVEGTENLLRSKCDVASVVKTYFLYTYAGGSSFTTSIEGDTDDTGTSVKVQLDGEQGGKHEQSVDDVHGTQLKGDTPQQCASLQFSAESTTGDPNSEEPPRISATSLKGEDEQGDSQEVVQPTQAHITTGSNSNQDGKRDDKLEEKIEEQHQSVGEAVEEEPPCGHSNGNSKGSDMNSAEKGEHEVVEVGDVSSDVAQDELSTPPGEEPDKASSTDSIPHFGEGEEEQQGEEQPEQDKKRDTRMKPERSWKSCVEQMKEIVKAYRKKYLTDRTRLFGLNQDVAFKIFTTFYRVTYKRKREKYMAQFDDLCTGACTYNDIILLCDEAVKVFKGEDSIEHVDLPCKVFGDLHGNIFDLLDFFNMYNWPLHGDTNEWLSVDEVATSDATCMSVGKANEASVANMAAHEKDVKYVFLGNYVNRGNHSLEVICLLLSLKILFPKHIYLLRGNHEERLFNYVHGFYADIENKMERNGNRVGLIRYQGEVIQAHAYELFNRINDVLEFLPLSVLVGGNILCVHAGIGDSLHKVEDFGDVHKPIVVPQCVDRTRNGNYERVHKIIVDTLWSDPINYEDEQDMFLLQKLKSGEEDIIPSSRGKITLKFGQKRLSSFLKKNKLKMVIRGHECVQEGYRYGYSRRLLTLFSATNYCGRYGNDAANAFIVKRGKSIVIFNQILKCPGGGQLEGSHHGEEMTTGQLEALHNLKRDGTPDGGSLETEHGVPYSPEPLHWGNLPHEVGQPQHGVPALSGQAVMANEHSPWKVPPLGAENWRSGSPFSRVDQIGDASTDRMGSHPKITMSKVAYSVRNVGGEHDHDKDDDEEEMSCNGVHEEVTAFNPNEKELTSDADSVEDKTLCNSASEERDDAQINHILRDSHSIVKRKLRDTRSNEHMNWGAAVQLGKREGVPSRFPCSGAGVEGANRQDGHFLSHSRNSMGDDHSNGDATDDNMESGSLRKSIRAKGTFSSEEDCSHVSSARNYTGELLSSKRSHFKGEGLEKAQNRKQHKSHLKADPHWEGEYLYADYEQCSDNLSHGDALKDPSYNEPDSSDEFLCTGGMKQDSRVNTNAIIEKFFQHGEKDHWSGKHISTDHLEDKEVERGGDLNHYQCAKLTPLSKRTNDMNVKTGEDGGEWGQNGSCANLMDEMMSKPMDYMMMPPDLGLVNRPKVRRDTHSNMQKKDHGSTTLRSLRSLRNEHNTSESLSKLQMQCLPPDPKPQTKISLQKNIDKLEDDV